jgi:putative DNA primase/helicase
MNDPTADDLEKLLEWMDKQQERTAGKNGSAGTTPMPEHAVEEKGPAQPHERAEPEPSKMIFGRNLRNPELNNKVYLPEQYRVDPKKVYIDPLLIERLSDVPSYLVEWLWPGRIPLGRVTLLAGDPGICKSLVALDIAARVTTGAPWPDAPGRPRDPAGVIIFSMEDDLRDTIKPRLMRAGADAERTYVIEGICNKPPFRDLRYKRRFRVQEDILSLRQAIQELSPVRLVVFDPITAYCGNGDGVAMSVVHSMLAPLLELAAKDQVAILCTTHLRGSSRKAVYQAAGNLSFTTAARAVWGLVPDARDKTRRLMVPVKMNLAPETAGLAFRIDPQGRLVWESEAVSLSADEALQDQRAASKHTTVIRWLRELLAAGSQSSECVMAQGKELGFSKSTIYRAAAVLKVAKQQGGAGDAKCSTWSLRV